MYFVSLKQQKKLTKCGGTFNFHIWSNDSSIFATNCDIPILIPDEPLSIIKVWLDIIWTSLLKTLKYALIEPATSSSVYNTYHVSIFAITATASSTGWSIKECWLAKAKSLFNWDSQSCFGMTGPWSTISGI